MDSHTCQYCSDVRCSREIVLSFTNGRHWVMPEMILHYVADHAYLPPEEFVDEVMTKKAYESRESIDSKSSDYETVGYLDGPFPDWTELDSEGRNRMTRFFVILWSLIEKAKRNSQALLTRGNGRHSHKREESVIEVAPDQKEKAIDRIEICPSCAADRPERCYKRWADDGYIILCATQVQTDDATEV